MRHGRKSASRRFDGHKLDVITDEDSEMVLGVEVRATNASDGEGAVPLLGQVMALPGIVVATLLGDMAYSDGDVRQAVEEQGAELVAKVPPVTNGGRFPKTDFEIDLQAGSVTCPAGVTTTDARPARDHKAPQPGSSSPPPPAPPARCWRAAPQPKGAGRSWSACMSPHCRRPGGPDRPGHQGAAAPGGPRWSARSTTSRLGMGKARYRGRRKTRLQALLAATVANFKRLGVLGAFDASAPSPLLPDPDVFAAPGDDLGH